MTAVKIRHQGLVPARLALECVLEDAGPVGEERLDLGKAAGRVLAETLAARRTQPPFAASAMDGYAVRTADLFELPAVLHRIGESAAGHPFTGEIAGGECIRIFTGAPVPQSADTIVIQENTRSAGDRIEILEAPAAGKFIRPAGLDFREGDRLLEKGSVLDPQNLALAAAMDHPAVSVFARPRVAILATGDELVPPGGETGPGQIIASNTFGIAAIAADAGAEIDNLGIAADRMEDHIQRIETALENGADLIVTSGGASVGDHDLVMPVMARLGFSFAFTKIAMRPGKPVMFASAEIGGKRRRFLGLAGNPVSSLVSSHIFMAPLIRLLGGYPAETIEPLPAKLTVDLPANDEREDYLRATARRDGDGGLSVMPFERQDSSMLATLARADCLVRRPVAAPPAAAGDTVDVIVLKRV